MARWRKWNGKYLDGKNPIDAKDYEEWTQLPDK